MSSVVVPVAQGSVTKDETVTMLTTASLEEEPATALTATPLGEDSAVVPMASDSVAKEETVTTLTTLTDSVALALVLFHAPEL